MVVSPLIALMQSQVDFLVKKLGIRAARLGSTVSARDKAAVFADLALPRPTIKLLYVSPELLQAGAKPKTAAGGAAAASAAGASKAVTSKAGAGAGSGSGAGKEPAAAAAGGAKAGAAKSSSKSAAGVESKSSGSKSAAAASAEDEEAQLLQPQSGPESAGDRSQFSEALVRLHKNGLLSLFAVDVRSLSFLHSECCGEQPAFVSPCAHAAGVPLHQQLGPRLPAIVPAPRVRALARLCTHRAP